MAFELVVDQLELGISLGQRVFHRRLVGAGFLARRFADFLRRADAGDHVFALRVDQKFAIKLLSPVDGLRVKATPVAEVSPILPKTIACTFTAVPQLSGILCSFR